MGTRSVPVTDRPASKFLERRADSEQLWRLTVQHSPVGMSLASPEGRIVAVNDALCHMLGYAADELCSRTFSSRSTTSKVGDFRRDSYFDTDDCWVRAMSANRRCERPAALRATSITVIGFTHQ